MSPLPAFYDEQPDRALRFGDVITGFQTVTPHLHKPGSDIDVELGITVTRCAYYAVMTPCCSIENKSITLAPLLSIRPAFLRNPYFEEDLTRINRKVPPEKFVSPEVWQKLLPERREIMRATGEAYTLMECFIYAEDPRLKRYKLHVPGGPVDMGFYLLDFKSIYRIDCDLIVRGKDAPTGTKYLQLTVPVREQLRQKLASYFVRRPEEDQVFLG
jgi:hypothetical protein